MYFLIDLIRRNLLIFVFLLIGTILTIILMISGTFNKELVLQKTSPQQGQTETIYNTDPVVFYFSESIDQKTIQISISPPIKFNFKTETNQEGGTISINPIPWWNFDTNYTIVVSKNLKGTTGSRLKQDFTFTFSLTFPKTENLPAQPGPPPGYPDL